MATSDMFAMPAPKYEVRLEPSVFVPMRDGARLSTDLYVPVGAGDKLPVILMRTPYNKLPHRQPERDTWMFAGQGYVVAVQDVRGKFESEVAENMVHHAARYPSHVLLPVVP